MLKAIPALVAAVLVMAAPALAGDSGGISPQPGHGGSGLGHSSMAASNGPITHTLTHDGPAGTGTYEVEVRSQPVREYCPVLRQEIYRRGEWSRVNGVRRCFDTDRESRKSELHLEMNVFLPTDHRYRLIGRIDGIKRLRMPIP